FAGLSIPLMSEAIGNYKTVLWTVGMATLAALLLAVFPVIWLYLVLNALLGWGNAGSRVARSTIMLTFIPNALIGRVNVLFNLLERLLRTFIVLYLSSRMDERGAPFGFGVIGAMIGLAWIGAALSRKSVPVEGQG